MYGPLLSVLLMGMIPVWGASAPTALSQLITVAPPALTDSRALPLLALSGQLSASGVIVMDLQSGQTLYQKNSAVSRPMASLTKLMTALIIVEHHALTEVVTVPPDIIAASPGESFHLPPGEKFTVGDLLSAMLIASSNDAAVALARFHSGTVSAFAEEMNERATTLGLTHTSYQNPVGLDAPMQDSTPQDLAWLAMYVMRNSDIRQRMSTADTQIRSIGGDVISLIHTHRMLHEDSFVIAGKTGTTDAAGECLLSIVDEHDRRYVVVLLHSRDRYADMRAILKQFNTDIAQH